MGRRPQTGYRARSTSWEADQLGALDGDHLDAHERGEHHEPARLVEADVGRLREEVAMQVVVVQVVEETVQSAGVVASQAAVKSQQPMPPQR